MNFKKQTFGFMDMLRFRKLVPQRQKALASGSAEPLPEEYPVNRLASQLHPGYMSVRTADIKELTDRIKEFTFERTDGKAFPFFRAGQYVSLRIKAGDSIVSRPYSIVSSPAEALEGKIVLAVEKSGFVSSYLHEHVSEGDICSMSEPSGSFFHEPLRDSEEIVCIAGGSGITPFVSMARSRMAGDEDFSMTLIYAGEKWDAMAYADELDAMNSEHVKVVYVLSDEERDGCEKGFVTEELIRKYADPEKSTFFICGSPVFHNYMKKEMKNMGLPARRVRKDEQSCADRVVKDPSQFRLTVHIRDEVHEIRVMEYETLLTAMERAGIEAPNKCRAGICGFCHSRWISGKYTVAEDSDGRREADRKFGYIHPCCTYPDSDIEIEVPYGYDSVYGSAAGGEVNNDGQGK